MSFFETRLVVECDEGIMTTILAQIRFQPEGSATKTYIDLKIEGGGPSSYDTNKNIIFNRMNYDLISDPNDPDYDSDYPEFKEFILSGLDGTECICQEGGGGDDPDPPICIDCRDVWQNASKNQPSCKLEVGAMGNDDMGGTCDICTTVNNAGLVPFMELGQGLQNFPDFGKWQWQSGFVPYCANPTSFNVAVSLKCVSGCSSTMQAPGFVCTNNSGCVQEDTKLWWTISVLLYTGGVWGGSVCSCDISVVDGKLVSPPISITLLRSNTEETCVGVVRFAPALGANVVGVGGNNAVGGADDVCLTRIPVTKAIAYPRMPCPTDPRLPIPTATPGIDCRVLPNEWSHQVGYCGGFGLYGVHDAHFKRIPGAPHRWKSTEVISLAGCPDITETIIYECSVTRMTVIEDSHTINGTKIYFPTTGGGPMSWNRAARTVTFLSAYFTLAAGEAPGPQWISTVGENCACTQNCPEGCGTIPITLNY